VRVHQHRYHWCPAAKSPLLCSPHCGAASSLAAQAVPG
jgi:hypothetical protein